MLQVKHKIGHSCLTYSSMEIRFEGEVNEKSHKIFLFFLQGLLLSCNQMSAEYLFMTVSKFYAIFSNL